MEVPNEMQLRYLERRKKDLELCLFNLEQGNFSELERVGHQLKGNGMTFGHADLSLIGSHLEISAKVQNMTELEKALKDFSFWLNQHIN